MDELTDILAARAEVGLEDGAVDREILREIADEAAGDARTGITALKTTAEIATERGRETINPADIPVGFERAQRTIREENLASLTWHHHVLYELIREAGELPPPALHDRYDSAADELYQGVDVTPIGSRSRRFKLEKLVEYDLVEFDGTNQYDDVYQVCDPAVTSSVSVPIPVTDNQ